MMRAVIISWGFFEFIDVIDVLLVLILKMRVPFLIGNFQRLPLYLPANKLLFFMLSNIALHHWLHNILYAATLEWKHENAARMLTKMYFYSFSHSFDEFDVIAVLFTSKI